MFKITKLHPTKREFRLVGNCYGCGMFLDFTVIDFFHEQTRVMVCPSCKRRHDLNQVTQGESDGRKNKH